MLCSSPPEIVFPPHFLNIVFDMKASDHQCPKTVVGGKQWHADCKQWLGGKQGHAACKQWLR